MELYQTLVMFVLGALFGYVGRKLSEDEKEIFKKKQYFPTFKIILFLISLMTLFVDLYISIITTTILIMVVVWDLESRE